MVQQLQDAYGEDGFQFVQATNATDDEAGVAILQEWEAEYALSRIPVLGVGGQAQLDAWDLDGACPSVYVLEPDMTLRVVDEPLDLEALEAMLLGVSAERSCSPPDPRTRPIGSRCASGPLRR